MKVNLGLFPDVDPNWVSFIQAKQLKLSKGISGY